jgi:hypothetical protein
VIWRSIKLFKRRRGLVPALAVAAAMLAAAPAQACQYEFAPEPIGGPSARFIMPRMFNAASFVDLVVAEGSQQLSSLPAVPQGPDAEAQSFRVIQRWKGSSTDRFILLGSKGDGQPEWTMTHWTDEQGRIYPFMSVREAEVGSLMALHSCSPPTIAPKAGTLHIVFREADGRLLSAVPYHADMRPVAGTSIVEVDPLWLETDLGREAHAAEAYARSLKLPALVETAEPRRATVRFRQPLTSDVVKALLTNAGAMPFGVTLLRGQRTMDYRLGSEVAMLRLVDDAVAWAQRTSTPRSLVTAHASALLDGYSLGSLHVDGPQLRFLADILRLAREPEEQGAVRISAVQVVAGPAIQQALARQAQVAAVVPGRRIRNRAVIDAPAPAPIAALPTPLAVHRGLAAVTGRNHSASDLAGKWRLVASFTPLEEEALTLEFIGDRVRAAMPCAAESIADYRIEGHVLEMQLPKPDLKACPQRRAFWTAADMFEKTLFTVRMTGGRMRLLTDNGGDLEFAR